MFAAIWAWIYGCFMAVFTFPKRLMAMTLPAQVGWLTALFLMICVVIVAIAVWRDPKMVPWFHWLSGWRVALILGLIIVIPFVVYQALKLWLEGEASRFPDIDYAWKAGLDELAKNGLALTETPLFLVLGSANEQQERSLLGASRLSLRVKQSPQGPAALHWYANPDGIYLVATECSVLSKLAEIGRRKDMYSGESPETPAASSGGGGGNIRGTIVIGQQMEEAPAAPRGGGGGIRGTMILGGGGDIRTTLDAPAATSTSTAPRRKVVMPAQEAQEALLRLQYLCQLLARARAPLCAVNGVLTLIPFEVIENGSETGLELQRAIQQDIGAMLDTLGVRCPVTALVVGMEAEPGFSELVHRVGQQRAVQQRFGKGFQVWSPPDPEQLEAVTAHACGAFEDWVYTLFREKGSLARPGNTKLYAMLCKIRRNMGERLKHIIAGGYGNDAEKNPHGDTMLFSGCYFAATGESEDAQAFVKGVFDKLVDEQEELEWSRTALRRHRSYTNWGRLGLGVDVLLGLTLTAMIVYSVWLKK